jgi:hypothetical protein
VDKEDLDNESRYEPIEITADLLVAPSIYSTKEDFFLCEADFLRLKNGKHKSLNAAIAFLTASIGFFIPFIAKFIGSKIDSKPFVYDTWEWVAPAISVVVSIIIFLIYQFSPNDHKKVMKAIEEHFRSAKRTRHIQKKGGRNG